MTIQTWLDKTTAHFATNEIKSAWLDALLLLESVSNKDRAWILAHANETITGLLTLHQLEQLVSDIARRANHEPIAYIVGKKEFYGRSFAVTKDVLIPRPESEAFLELLPDVCNHEKLDKRLLDVGTGSGALAISTKLSHPHLTVSATDISRKALRVALNNALSYDADVSFIQSDLLENVHEKQDIIVANLPYVPVGFLVNQDVLHEPALAVFCQDDGLALIRQLFVQLPHKLQHGGFVFIESLEQQTSDVQMIAAAAGCSFVKKLGLVQVFQFG